MKVLKIENKIYWRALGMMLLISVLIAGIGYYYAGDVKHAYNELKKPNFAISSSGFIFLWLASYLFMAIASYRIYCHLRHEANTKSEKEKMANSFYWYALLLIANAVWLVFLFHYHSFKWAFILLLGIVFISIKLRIGYNKVDKTAGLLYIFLLTWQCYLLILQMTIRI